MAFQHCKHCGKPLETGVSIPVYGLFRFCSEQCKRDWIVENAEELGLSPRDTISILRTLPPVIQIPLPFPPSALNAPKETLRMKVKQDVSIASLVDEWYIWLNHDKQTIYNRVEFKYKGTYVVLAKLKPESEKDD